MKIAFADVETTGLDASLDEIISYCVCIWDNGATIPSCNRRVMPSAQGIERGNRKGGNGKSAFDINGFTVEEWQRSGAVPWSVEDTDSIAKIIRDSAEGRALPVMGGHNVQFDLGFFRSHMRNDFPNVSHRVIDTMPMGQLLAALDVIKSSGLGPLARALGVQVDREHTASDDVFTTIRLFEKQLEIVARGVGLIAPWTYQEAQAHLNDIMARAGL